MSTFTRLILQDAKDIVRHQEQWCQGFAAIGRDGKPTDTVEGAVKFCIIGAVMRSSKNYSDNILWESLNPINALEKVSREHYGRVPSEVNDALGHEHVIRLLDLTIDYVMQEEHVRAEERRISRSTDRG